MTLPVPIQGFEPRALTTQEKRGKNFYEEHSYLTTDGQSVSLSWYQATVGARDKFCFLLEMSFRQSAGLLFCGALSDERLGL
jgi:hypothetical protein